MYYNPETKTRKTHKELSRELNCSFPKLLEYINGYYLLHEEEPVITNYQIATENDIELIDGHYTLTYTISYKDIDIIKTMRLNEVEHKFETASKNAFIVSSLGFRINADEVANRNVEGLIKVLKSEGISEEMFRDYDNEFRTVSLQDLETMQLEIIKNGQYLYKQKWASLNEISNISDVKELVSYNITYKNMDFSNVNE